jgi:hypothetical protein
MQTAAWSQGSGWRRLVSLGLSVGLAGAALLLLGRWAGGAAAAGPRPAVTYGPSVVVFVVTNTVDAPDSYLGDHHCHIVSGDQPCSLRAAVQQLDTDNGGSIILLAGTYNLTDTVAGDLQLQKDIQVYAGGAGNTIIQGSPAGWTHRSLRI